MQKIKSNFRKNGLEFKLLERSAHVALYELNGENGIRAYEVHKLRILPCRALNGVILEACERLAGNEDFGIFGWSYQELEYVQKKYNELLTEEKKKSQDELMKIMQEVI